MRKINDKIILGLVVGLLANIPKFIICEILYYKGLPKIKCSELVASLFLTTKKVKSKKGNLFGILCDFIVASFNGISYIYLLTYTGKDYALFKGFINGIFSFGLLRGIVSKLGIGGVYPKDIVTNIVMGINSSIWGFTTGLLTLLLGDKELFKPRIQSTPTQM